MLYIKSCTLHHIFRQIWSPPKMFSDIGKPCRDFKKSSAIFTFCGRNLCETRNQNVNDISYHGNSRYYIHQIVIPVSEPLNIVRLVLSAALVNFHCTGRIIVSAGLDMVNLLGKVERRLSVTNLSSENNSVGETLSPPCFLDACDSFPFTFCSSIFVSPSSLFN